MTKRAPRVARHALAIRPMAADDWPAVGRIHGEGIATGDATLEAAPPTFEAFNRAHHPGPRLVASADGLVVAWFALAPWSSRPVYRGVAWESIYVAADRRGEGIGRQLLKAGITAAEEAGLWTLMAGVQLENVASLALHASLGFRRLGLQERVAQDPTGRWRSVVLLERRSKRVGID
jgi:L-amino acid N-acyltransferase YncA